MSTLTSRNDVTWGAGEAVATSWRGYQFTDALGSVTQTATGAQIEYDAFGGIKTRSDAPDEQADTLTKIAASRVGYTGQFFDTETGLQPLGNGERYYNPKIGRFIQADSWLGDGANPMSFNRYAYGFNNPQGYRDPSGNNPISEFFGTAKMLVGVALGGDAYFEAEERRMAAIARGEDPANLPDSTALALADFTGMTSIFKATTGTDPYTGENLSWTERVNEGIFGTLMLVGTAFDLGAVAKLVGGASRFARAEQKLVGSLGRWAERLGEGGDFAKKIGRGIERVTDLSDEGRAMKLAEAEARGGRAAEETIGAESRGERAVAETADEAGTAERTADDVTKSRETSGAAPGCMRCFTEGTEVVGEDGESSRVERVKAGDRVAAYDEAGKTVTGRNVVKTFARIVPETIKLRPQGEPKALEVSPDHPFFAKRARSNTSGEKDADGEWREAFRLRIGDLVKTRSGKWVRVLRVTHLKQPKVVYNFEVAKSHTYFVGRQWVLVHNSSSVESCPFTPDYPAYRERKLQKGETPRELDDYVKTRRRNEARFGRGNRFNQKARDEGWYAFDEIHLENGKRLDSFDPASGRIVSRKAVTFESLTENTFLGYLDEFSTKYKRGTKIQSLKYPELSGTKFRGNYFLEVPDVNLNSRFRSQFEAFAKKKKVTLIYRPE